MADGLAAVSLVKLKPAPPCVSVGSTSQPHCFRPPSENVCTRATVPGNLMNVCVRGCVRWATPCVVTLLQRRVLHTHGLMVSVHILTTWAKWTPVFAQQHVIMVVPRTSVDEFNGSIPSPFHAHKI
ncbi:hypothetical protein Q5P01_009528 [Channa striata]|uniref:Uncharacterized protein n=1 Tax=Channa striata TaxID=64152 RepID=A0AA88MW97_CHASR|nr:hypothetical protein Q5P01_009528 [Channa striata]